MANLLRAVFFAALSAAALAVIMGRLPAAAALTVLALAALAVFIRAGKGQLIPLGRIIRRMGLTKVGWSAVFFVLFVLASAVQSGANLLYFLAALITLAIVFALAYAVVVLRGTTFSLSTPHWAFAGEASRCDALLKNVKRVTPIVALNVEIDLGRAGSLAAVAAALPPASTAVLEIPFVPAGRGAVREARTTLWTVGLVGFVKRSRRVALPVSLVVYPSVAGVAVPAIPWRPRDAGRSFAAREGDFAGLREWRPGDSLRHVHWRSSARTGKLLTKEFVRTRHSEALILLDTFGDEGRAFENAVSRAAGLAVAASSAGYAVRLAWYDRAVRVARDPGDGPLPHGVLRALADVRAQQECPFARLRRLAVADPAAGMTVFDVAIGPGGPREAADAA